MTDDKIPMNYHDLYGVDWNDLGLNFIENSDSERQLANQQLTWDWTPAARQALTKFRRIEGLFLSVDELKEDLENEWGQVPKGILEFQKELAGIYFETGREGKVLLGISHVAPKSDFNPGDMPCEEFFFSNYDDWGFKYFLRHDMQVYSVDMIEYNDVKICLENQINRSESRFFNSEVFSLYVELNSITLSKALEMNIVDTLTNLDYKEILACRDNLNWLYVSRTGYAYKAMAWNRENVLRFHISFISNSREEVEFFRTNIESIGIVLRNTHADQESRHTFWRYVAKESPND